MAHHAVPAVERKIAFDHWRAKIGGELKIAAVECIVADKGCAAVDACQVGDLTEGVCGLAHRGLGGQVPASGGKRWG